MVPPRCCPGSLRTRYCVDPPVDGHLDPPHCGFQGDEPETQGLPPTGWSQRDRDVLVEMARGDDTRVGFQGLKRRLELHPEALRRSLKRLAEEGVVAKTPAGYHLTGQGHEHVRSMQSTRQRAHPMPVAAFLLPSGIANDSVERRFHGKWFDGLHWYGVEPGPSHSVLRWLTSENAFVSLNAGQGTLRIDVTCHGDPDHGVRAAAPLVAAVASWLRTSDARQDKRAAS